MNNSLEIRDHTILLCVSGSRAYGLHNSSSDVDLKGVAIPPKEYIIGCDYSFEQADAHEHIKTFYQDLTDKEKEVADRIKLEGTVYSIQKFMKLASDANPSILDALFCRDSEVRVCNSLGKKLRDNRHLFISSKAKHTFSGYAISQLKRIKRHKRWLMQEMPTTRPLRKDFDLFDGIEQKQVDAALSMVRKVIDGWELDLSRLDKSERIPIMNGVEEYMAELKISSDDKWRAAGRTLGFSENFLEILDRERKYKNSVEDWKKYNNWKANRNPERALMEKNFGYDLKHASHLVRLLSQCEDLMKTGDLKVWLEDNRLIKEVRAGEWSYEKLLKWAEEKESELDAIYKNKEYVIPHKVDRKKINDLCVEIIEEFLESKK